MLGAFIEVTKVVKMETLLKALEQVLPERYHKRIPLNKQAIEIGMGLVRK